ncbi:MAG TPA: arsinothricin resistance N-acetyltransferase ArsN1 family B [Burkholderiaceae bacterium]|jgi:L-amino acid N-acyltransferase YncA|nr:arsinothricin resistance N-acetyltransferase ArsN1 family B [Burkholderiaceae bacterium]
MIRPAIPADASAIVDIYNPYVATTTITFEEAPVSVEEMEQRIRTVTATLPWYVHEISEQIVGYAYATPWRARSAYRLSVETTVYVAEGQSKQGIGSQLYRTLLDNLRERNIHAILGHIALPNPASIALHERFGFEKVAHIKQVGRKFDQWIDVGYWELLLEN